MATSAKTGSRKPNFRNEEYFTKLAYSRAGQTRFTQDSPILPDVLVHYGMNNESYCDDNNNEKRVDLLLTPDWEKAPGEVAEELKKWLGVDINSTNNDQQLTYADVLEIAHNQSVVAARLTFEELICNVLPMSWWWQNSLMWDKTDPVTACQNEGRREIIRKELRLAVMIETGELEPQECDACHWLIRQDLAWAARIFYVVQHSNCTDGEDESDRDADAIVSYFIDNLIPKISSRQQEVSDHSSLVSPWVYSIDRNRSIDSSMYSSVSTTKVDAALKTFNVTGKSITWAIVDTGIDARHMAFRKMQPNGEPYQRAFDKNGINNTRIKATYDFSDIRKHLRNDAKRSFKSGGSRLIDWESIEQKLGDNLRVPHRDWDQNSGYRTPIIAHGTHVAGILGGSWTPGQDNKDPLGPPSSSNQPEKSFKGLCPDIEFYDLRVFRPDGSGDEFAVMSALQFVRSLNQRHDTLEVHGVNLSLAMRHEVSNYACGRTPVCVECAKLVGNGVVVVAAAGNEGRSIHTTTQQTRQEGYRLAGIADPGNTEAVITVGSTHRREPYNYGVSYFSSRGPTGDGRLKPDLVAPGEKILSTVPGDQLERQDGTSQAAPHVSGAAALLMSRHKELIGQPERVKKILMDSATDLGREKYFQGAGLVDVMRAIQSV